MDEQILYYLQGELSSAEQSEFIRRVESDAALKKTLIEYQNLYALLSLESQAGDRQEGIEKLARFQRQTKNRSLRNLFMKIGGVAAAIVLLIAGTWFTAISYQSSDLLSAMHTLTVPAGQRACLTLEDGTQVWLNARSTLMYPARFSAKERKVILSGEAYLTVEKDVDRPFIVSVQGVNVEVLGTIFNVSGYPETHKVETSLIEGAVKMYPQADPSSHVILHPNQEACYENGNLTVHPFSGQEMFSWKEGVYSFDNEPFDRIIEKLQLYYDVRIQVKDPSILDFEYSGKFRQRDGIYKILQIIQKIQKFEIEVDDENNIITLKK